MNKLFCLIIGFIFTVIGLTYIICYLNLLTAGYNFLEYVNFISKRLECIIFIIGLLLIFIMIFKRRKE